MPYPTAINLTSVGLAAVCSASPSYNVGRLLCAAADKIVALPREVKSTLFHGGERKNVLVRTEVDFVAGLTASSLSFGLSTRKCVLVRTEVKIVAGL